MAMERYFYKFSVMGELKMENKTLRTPELVLGIIGCVLNGLGAFGALLILMFISILGNMFVSGLGTFIGVYTSTSALLLVGTTVIGIIATIKLKTDEKLAGWMYVGASIGVFIASKMGGLIVIVLYLTAGLMTLYRKVDK
jgi:hypothetical protein